MARSLRDLRRKMKAIKSTRQVTKAMELVAASKMRRAVGNAQQLKRYALTAWRVLENLAEIHPDIHPFLKAKPVENVLAILFTSDRGLCGSLNTQLFKAAAHYSKQLKALPTFKKLDFAGVGRKGQQFLARTRESLVAAFPALSNHPTFKDALPICSLAVDGFLAGTYDHVVIIFPDFKSALVQEATVKALLPLSRDELKQMIEQLGRKKQELPASSPQLPAPREYLFEPSQDAIASTILPQLLKMQVYQAILEAAASEHSARMVAMRNASDNASDLLDDLTLTYNQTRQANITAELSELSAAMVALG